MIGESMSVETISQHESYLTAARERAAERKANPSGCFLWPEHVIEPITVLIANKSKSNSMDGDVVSISLARVKWMERGNV